MKVTVTRDWEKDELRTKVELCGDIYENTRKVMNRAIFAAMENSAPRPEYLDTIPGCSLETTIWLSDTPEPDYLFENVVGLGEFDSWEPYHGVAPWVEWAGIFRHTLKYDFWSKRLGMTVGDMVDEEIRRHKAGLPLLTTIMSEDIVMMDEVEQEL